MGKQAVEASDEKGKQSPQNSCLNSDWSLVSPSLTSAEGGSHRFRLSRLLWSPHSCGSVTELLLHPLCCFLPLVATALGFCVCQRSLPLIAPFWKFRTLLVQMSDTGLGLHRRIRNWGLVEVLVSAVLGPRLKSTSLRLLNVSLKWYYKTYSGAYFHL